MGTLEKSNYPFLNYFIKIYIKNKMNCYHCKDNPQLKYTEICMHTKATCKLCGKFVKFVSKESVDKPLKSIKKTKLW
jgi:hypothetical protein